MQNKPPYGISSADHILKLLLLLQRRGRLRVTDAANALQVSRSTAHRLLGMLRYRGFATQDASRAYRTGPVFYAIGLGGPASADLRLRIRPHLEWLKQQVDETVHLMVLSGGDVHILDSVETTQPLRIGSRVGIVLPAYRTSGGKALLAELPDHELDELYPAGLADESPPVVTDLATLRTQLDDVRKQGYGKNHNESGLGIAAIGMCVRDSFGQPMAALTVSIPEIRLTEARVADVVAALQQAVERAHRDPALAGAEPSP